MSNAREVCIVGVGESEFTRGSKRSAGLLARDAVTRAAADAGISIDRIDGVVPTNPDLSVEELIVSLGLPDVAFSGRVQLGGAAAVASLGLAEMALLTGRSRYVLVCFARNGYSGKRIGGRSSFLPGERFRTQLEHPVGWHTPAQLYAAICRRHMHVFGTTKEQMGTVAVTMRRHAQLNEKAMMHGRNMTLEDYFESPMIADPYQRFDCCLETDGAAALILALGDRSHESDNVPVVLAAVAEGRPESPDDIASRADWLRIGLHQAAPRAFGRAEIGPEDVGAAMVYDCFTFQLMHQLEAAGFCGDGEAGPFVESGAIALGGRLPVNTHGGLLSEGHLGGVNHVVEAVRQLRGECGERQVPDVKWVAVTGWGDLGDGSIALLRGAAA